VQILGEEDEVAVPETGLHWRVTELLPGL